MDADPLKIKITTKEMKSAQKLTEITSSLIFCIKLVVNHVLKLSVIQPITSSCIYYGFFPFQTLNGEEIIPNFVVNLCVNDLYEHRNEKSVRHWHFIGQHQIRRMFNEILI